jgi:hypothetical protein
MNTEDVFAALFALLTPIGPSPGSGPFVTLSRRLKNIEQMQAAEFPAVFQFQGTQPIPEYTLDGMQFQRAHALWYVMGYQPSQTGAISTVLNNLRDAVMPVLASGLIRVGIDQTAVGAFIREPVEFFDGVLTDRGFFVIPITLLPVDL